MSSLMDEVAAALAGYIRLENYPDLQAEPTGDDAVRVMCDPLYHHWGQTVLGQEIAPLLQAAGFDVQFDGGLRQIPGLPPGIASGTRGSSRGAAQQRAAEPPSLLVRRPA